MSTTSISEETFKQKTEMAKKKLASNKQVSNYLAIQYQYNKAIILPYKEGIQFMASLECAEEMDTGYGTNQGIGAFDASEFKTLIISEEEYRLRKMASLMQIPFSELTDKAILD